MPQIKKKFFNCYDGVGNNVYVDFIVGETDGNDKVSNWLIEQGCKDGEEVLIKHWW